MKSLLTAAFFAVASCTPALAQTPECAPAEPIAEYLETEYGEEIAAYGLTSNGAVLEFGVNNQTGTWTLILRRGDMRCPIDAGQGGASNVIGEVF